MARRITARRSQFEFCPFIPTLYDGAGFPRAVAAHPAHARREERVFRRGLPFRKTAYQAIQILSYGLTSAPLYGQSGSPRLIAAYPAYTDREERVFKRGLPFRKTAYQAIRSSSCGLTSALLYGQSSSPRLIAAHPAHARREERVFSAACSATKIRISRSESSHTA